MSIRKKGKNWYYEFTIEGKRYNGTCDDCINKAQAIIFEKNIKKRTKEELAQSDIVAYHEKKIVEAKGITTISLFDAYDIAINKPLNHIIKEKTKNQNRQYFFDFALFANKEYNAIAANQIDRYIAEQYINYIRKNGRYSKIIQYTRNNKLISVQNTCTILSPSSINKIHKVCRQVFDLLSYELEGHNPFKHIPLLLVEYENRQIFTHDEIKKILSSNDTFCTPLFQLGLYTGLREGDACCLRWEEVNLEKGYICLKMRKTKKPVYIPIINREFFENLKNKSKDNEYVLPLQHEMYTNNPDGVSYRIKKFLENLGIVTTAKIENRHRRHSTKDFHSCRHTFAMFCRDRGIAMDNIQAVLGHTDPKTTQIYTRHDKVRYLQEAFARISSNIAKKPLKIKEQFLCECLESFYLLNDFGKLSFAKYLIATCDPERLFKHLFRIVMARENTKEATKEKEEEKEETEMEKNISQLIIDNPELMYEQ